MKCRQCEKEAHSVILGENKDGSEKVFSFAFCKETVDAIFAAYDGAARDPRRVFVQPRLVHVPSGDILRLEPL